MLRLNRTMAGNAVSSGDLDPLKPMIHANPARSLETLKCRQRHNSAGNSDSAGCDFAGCEEMFSLWGRDHL